MPPKGKRDRGEPPKGKMDRSEPPRGDHTLGGKPPSPPTMGLYLRTAYDSLSPSPPAAEQTAATPVSTPSPPAAWTMESPLSALLRSAATSSPEVKVLSDEEYSEMFLQFLRSHMEAGESFPLYKANAAALIERSCFILEVDYAHLLKSGVPKALALRIGNDKDRQPIWLRNAVRTFFEEVYEYVNTKRVEKLIPDNNKIKTARVVFRDKPKQANSWNGRFSAKHIVFFLYSTHMECRVMMSPAPSPEQAAARDKINPDHCTLDERVRDFSKIDELLMPLFKDEKGQLPVYFDDLSSDLRTKSVVAALWSKENFNYHPAVMPSPARRTLTGGIHFSAPAFKLSTDGRYKRLFEECPFDEDWRYTPMIEDDPIMNGVYWFENANKDRDLDEYENTVISALGMQRQVHQHGYQQLQGQALDDYDEGELYTAVKMPGVLTRIFKELLKLNGMGGKLEAVRDEYYSVHAVRREAGSKDLLLKD